MPRVCFDRPNRSEPRLFNERKAAAILCTVLKQGGSRVLFEQELEKHCPDSPRRGQQGAAEALAVAEMAIAENNALLDADAALLSRFSTVMAALAVVQRFIALAGVPGRVVALLMAGLQSAVSGRLQQIAVQKAANDGALAIVRRAAANEARFARTGTRG